MPYFEDLKREPPNLENYPLVYAVECGGGGCGPCVSSSVGKQVHMG